MIIFRDLVTQLKYPKIVNNYQTIQVFDFLTDF